MDFKNVSIPEFKYFWLMEGFVFYKHEMEAVVNGYQLCLIREVGKRIFSAEEKYYIKESTVDRFGKLVYHIDRPELVKGIKPAAHMPRENARFYYKIKYAEIISGRWCLSGLFRKIKQNNLL